MATLDSFREATGEPIQLDLANGYIADIRLNAGDINGRTITVELTDNGTPITTTAEITCALDYNTSPGSSLGDRVTMSPVSGAATATFRAAVPRKALAKPGRILLGIEISSGGHKVCSRNFYGLVERAVFDATSPDADDKLGRIEQLILDADKATSSANTAAGKANTAATAHPTPTTRPRRQTRPRPQRPRRPARPTTPHPRQPAPPATHATPPKQPAPRPSNTRSSPTTARKRSPPAPARAWSSPHRPKSTNSTRP